MQDFTGPSLGRIKGIQLEEQPGQSIGQWTRDCSASSREQPKDGGAGAGKSTEKVVRACRPGLDSRLQKEGRDLRRR